MSFLGSSRIKVWILVGALGAILGTETLWSGVEAATLLDNGAGGASASQVYQNAQDLMPFMAAVALVVIGMVATFVPKWLVVAFGSLGVLFLGTFSGPLVGIASGKGPAGITRGAELFPTEIVKTHVVSSMQQNIQSSKG